MAQFERSGEGQAAFCERRGLGLSALQHWLYRLRRERREAEKSGARFVPLVATGAPAAVRGACRLAVGRAEVSFAELPSAGYVAELLGLLGR